MIVMNSMDATVTYSFPNMIGTFGICNLVVSGLRNCFFVCFKIRIQASRKHESCTMERVFAQRKGLLIPFFKPDPNFESINII